jgi:uncharacterized membrane protein
VASEDDLRQQVAELSARVASLEAALQSLRAGRPDWGAPASMAAFAPVGAPAPPPVRAQAAAAGTKPSLESRIGAQLLNRLGILAVLIGVAWFLKLAFDRNWIGAEIRILIGLACAVALVVWSERFRSRGFSAFSYSLKALGTGIAYLSLWAAFSIFHLAPYWLIFLAMTAVTLANAVLARRQQSQLLAIYALVGGLATPGLLSVGHGNALFLFSYLALLNGGTLLLLAPHPWKRLAWSALLGTSVYYLGWTLGQDDVSRIPVTACFLGLFFANFAVVPWLIMRRETATVSLFPVAFPAANAAATWVGLMALFGAVDQHPVRPWVTVALALACLLMVAASRGPAALALSHTYLGLGIIFVTVAIALQYHGYQATLGWLAESLVLVVLARAGSRAVMRIFSTAVLMLAAYSLLVDWIAGSPQPLAVAANVHFATNVAGAVVFAAVTVISLGALRADPPARRGFGSWTWLAGFACVAFSLTVLITACLEIHHYWFCGAGFLRDYCGGYGQLERRSITAEFSYSACCMFYGAALMAVGFLRRSAFLRWQALGLLAFSIVIVFLSGVSHQSQGYRVFSFLALGVLLLAVSFAYQKDWLRLRG